MPVGPQKRVTELHTLGHQNSASPLHFKPVLFLMGTIWLNNQAVLEGSNDARTGMPSGIPEGAICVQRFDDSRNSAIHITYRISLRSSSMPEPRDPLLKVLNDCAFTLRQQRSCRVQLRLWWARARELKVPRRPHGGPTKATG